MAARLLVLMVAFGFLVPSMHVETVVHDHGQAAHHDARSTHQHQHDGEDPGDGGERETHAHLCACTCHSVVPPAEPFMSPGCLQPQPVTVACTLPAADGHGTTPYRPPRV